MTSDCLNCQFLFIVMETKQKGGWWSGPEEREIVKNKGINVKFLDKATVPRGINLRSGAGSLWLFIGHQIGIYLFLSKSSKWI